MSASANLRFGSFSTETLPACLVGRSSTLLHSTATTFTKGPLQVLPSFLLRVLTIVKGRGVHTRGTTSDNPTNPSRASILVRARPKILPLQPSLFFRLEEEKREGGRNPDTSRGQNCRRERPRPVLSLCGIDAQKDLVKKKSIKERASTPGLRRTCDEEEQHQSHKPFLVSGDKRARPIGPHVKEGFMPFQYIPIDKVFESRRTV